MSSDEDDLLDAFRAANPGKEVSSLTVPPGDAGLRAIMSMFIDGMGKVDDDREAINHLTKHFAAAYALGYTDCNHGEPSAVPTIVV